MKSEEQGYAALAHILAILPGWGIFFNVILWLNFKARSLAVSFHAKQAIAFQVMFLLPLLVVALVVKLISKLVGLMWPFLGTIVNHLNVTILVLATVFYVGYCLYAFWRVRTGQEFQYAFTGKLVKKFLSELD